MVNSFVASLDITVVINILHEITKILHEKIFSIKSNIFVLISQRYIREKNSQNGHSNKPWISE